MNRIVIVLTALAALHLPWDSADACGVSPKNAAGYEETAVEHAYTHWRQGERAPIPFLFVDVRTPEEYADGHIPGAVSIPLDELDARLDELPRNRQLYVYCRSGRRSAEASALLAGEGFDRVENLLGGLRAWRDAGHPTE